MTEPCAGGQYQRARFIFIIDMMKTPTTSAAAISNSTPAFPRTDPAAPEFWNMRFEAAFMPWDQGGIPACLRQYVDDLRLAAQFPPSKKYRTLIPGCGSAHEVKLFADLGWDVTAIDFSPAAVAWAQRSFGAGSALASMVKEQDFFGDTVGSERFDIVYERAFLCALPRKLWNNWSLRVAQIILPGGQLVGFFFSDVSDKGPPFGLAQEELEMMLLPNFTRTQLQKPADSIPIFADKETWQVWTRR